MKKIIALACLLAVMAILVVPMAASAATSSTGIVTVTGSFVAASVKVTAPGALAFGTFESGKFNIGSSPTMGKVEVTPGTSKLTDWVLKAQAATPNMKSGVNILQDYLLISFDGTWYKIANGGDGSVQGTGPYSGTLQITGSDASHNFDFYGKQWVRADDLPGIYTLSITFTATCTA